MTGLIVDLGIFFDGQSTFGVASDSSRGVDRRTVAGMRSPFTISALLKVLFDGELTCCFSAGERPSILAKGSLAL